MKASKMGSRDRRALLLGGAVVVPALLYVGAIMPAWRHLQADRVELAETRAALQRDSALIQRTATLRARQTETQLWLTRESRRLFHGFDDISATSGLADYVTRAAGQAGIKLRQTETRPSIPVTGGLHAVRLDVRAEGDTRSMITFLHLIEDGSRLARIGRLLIGRGAGAQEVIRPGPGAPPGMAGAMAAATPSTQGLNVAITADVYGYALLPPPDDIEINPALQGAPYQPMLNGTVPSVDIADALAHNPFSPDRNAPPPPSDSRRAPPPFPVTLVGTVVGHQGDDFAMCAINGRTATPVRRGEQVAGYTVRDIQRGSIVLADVSGKLVHLSIPTPGA